MIESAKKVIKRINDLGYEAYFVGGFVRDYLLDIPYNDIDIATNANWEVLVNKLNGIPTGVKYGTVSIKEDEYFFEVTTYRSESNYNDKRHPSTVIFINDLKGDLRRRDFTINAMAMDVNMKIIDEFNGLEDLKKGIIKAVDEPNKRFMEDALRILRAFYFVSKLGFDIEENTFKAIKNSSHLLINISGIRIQNEIKKIFNGKYKIKSLDLLNKGNILKDLPGLGNGLDYIDEAITYDEYLALSFYLDKKVTNYQFSNKELKIYNSVMKILDNKIDEYVQYLYKDDIIKVALRVYYLLNKENYPYEVKSLKINSISDLRINGKDLLKLNIEEYKIGKILQTLERDVVLNKIDNEKAELIKRSFDLLDIK